MSGKTRRKRVSKAAMLREWAALEEVAAQPRELDPAVAALIDTYSVPGLDGEHAEAVRCFMREVFTAGSVTGERAVRNQRAGVSGLAAFAVSRGLTLRLDVVMTTALIDEFIRVGAAGSSDAMRARRRTELLRMARVVNPGPAAPPQLSSIPHQAIRPPYTPAEMVVNRRVAREQPPGARRRDLCAVVALGAGAGADSVDLRRLCVEHVVDLGESRGWQVAFQAPRPRVVPVRVEYESLLAMAVADRPGDHLVIGTKVDRRNTASRVIDRAVLIGVPTLDQSRLRATWLADLMTDSVPLGVLLRTAGLQSARSLADLLPHLGPWLERKGLPATVTDYDVLRGGAR